MTKETKYKNKGSDNVLKNITLTVITLFLWMYFVFNAFCLWTQ